jgi:hypothetical protein
MTDGSIKSRALARIDAEHAGWSRIVAAAEGRIDMPGITPEWSLKDLAAHLTGWREDSLATLEAEAQGAPAPASPWPSELTDDDEINAWIYEKNKDRPAADVLADANAASERLRSLVAVLSDDDLANANLFPSLGGVSLGDHIVSGGMFGHYHEEHEADVRSWLDAGHIHHP